MYTECIQCATSMLPTQGTTSTANAFGLTCQGAVKTSLANTASLPLSHLLEDVQSLPPQSPRLEMLLQKCKPESLHLANAC